MTTAFKIDEKAVKKLAEILKNTDLQEIEYECDAGRVRVSRGGMIPATTMVAAPQAAPAPAPAPAAPAPTPAPEAAAPVDPAKHPGAVKSPMVATAYRSPQPGSAPFVKEGDQIKEGQTLLILEAMKVMNPLKATKSGTVTKVFVDDGTPVEYGDTLLIIE